MKTIVNVFHPNLATSRVNRALADVVEYRDIYGMYGDFQIDVEQEKAALESADRIVLQFPMYWYNVPPLLKKYLDDVLEFGWAYGGGTALHGKELLIAVTAGAQNYGRDNFAVYHVAELLRPLQATSRLIGTKYLKPFILEGASSITDERLKKAQAAYKEYVNRADIPVFGDFEIGEAQ